MNELISWYAHKEAYETPGIYTVAYEVAYNTYNTAHTYSSESDFHSVLYPCQYRIKNVEWMFLNNIEIIKKKNNEKFKLIIIL